MASIRELSQKKSASLAAKTARKEAPPTPKTESAKQKADRLRDEAARRAYIPSPPSKSFVGSLEDAIVAALSEGGERLAHGRYGWMGDGQVGRPMTDEPFVAALKAVRSATQNTFDNTNL